MSTPIQDLLPGVIPYVRDCAEFVAIDALRKAAIDFCTKSLIWQVDSDPQDLIAGEPEYTADAAQNGQVIRIMSVRNGQKPLTPTTYDILDRKWVDWRVKQGDPSHFVQDRYDTIRLVYTPDTATSQTLVIRAAMRPTRAATALDDQLADRWFDTLCAGAKARLMLMSNEPFYNPEMAVAEQRMYAAGLNEAKIESNKRLARTNMRVQFQHLGA